jgi:mannose-1-phosphate guanylyltransferase
VIEFIEKPRLQQARALLARGALWNTFIVATSARALLSMFDAQFDSTIVRMQRALKQADAARMATIYRSLPLRDFCRDVLAGNTSRLQAFPVLHCGWTDLGTPARVAQALERMPLIRPQRRWGPIVS